MKRRLALILIFAALSVPVNLPVHAQGMSHDLGHEQPVPAPADMPVAKTVVVMEHEVVPTAGEYVVTNDVNVRNGPSTAFKRIAGLLSGDRVRAVGKSEDGDWMAVSKDGETLGFVFMKMLAPVVDGALDEQFLGSYMSQNSDEDGVACDYRFRFERKVDVEGAEFQTADYEIRFRCASQKGASIFYGHMFLTEGPVNERKGLHLIGLDVRSIGDGLYQFLSTRYLYHPKSGKMTFKGHSLPRFAHPPKVQDFKTKSVKDALKQALEASIDSWTPQAWDMLLSKPDAKPE